MVNVGKLNRISEITRISNGGLLICKYSFGLSI